MRSGACSRSSSRPCARTASRRGAARIRDEFSDEEWRLVSELSGYPNRLLVTVDDRGGRDLRRGGARGDFPALGQAQGMDRRRARVPGLAQRPGGGPPRLGEDAEEGQERCAAHGLRADAGAELARQAFQATFPKPTGRSLSQSRKAAQRRKRRVQALVGVLVAADGRGRGGLVEPGLAEGRDLRTGERDRARRRRSAPSSRATHSQRVPRLPGDDRRAGGAFHDGLARGSRRRQRAPAARGDDRQAFRGGEVRADIRRMGRLRRPWRLRPACRRQRLGARPAPGDQRELGRRADLREMALQDHRQGISAAVRGRVRICGARRN